MARHYKVKLFKIASNHNNVRTDTIDGICRDLPSVDNHFFMWGEGLVFGTRLLETTRIKSCARVGNTITFETKNSTYTLHILDEFDDEATASTGGR